jgi:glycosyltransferase involved in cell wall biosynthesis
VSATSGAPPSARRLLWVNHFAAAPDMGGGTRHIELSRELVCRGWQVTLAASDFHLHRRAYTRRRSSAERNPITERIDGVDVAWLWTSPYTGNDLRRLGNWISFARSLLALDVRHAPPDVVIGSSPQLFAAWAGWRVARRAGVPFVFEVRDLWPETLQVTGRRRGPRYWALWVLARLLYRVADHVIVLAPGVASYLAARGIPGSRITLVPNGVDTSQFKENGAAPREVLRLVYAGAHGPINGLDTVLEAARLLESEPRVSFVLLGDGPAKSELVARAQSAGLRNLTFADPIPKSDMPAFLASCDAGLMVLREAPLFDFGVSPNKLFDYWAASLPVVCNVGGEVASWVRSAGGGVQAADGSGPALADAVRRLLALAPAERRRLGSSGRRWVEREHDRAHLANRLDVVLRRLLHSRRP